ncbi:MAG: cytidylate kinase-like family protein [Gemmataceae bacterium]|nr:cytidylate kinase-like family protein [Gemmataceae bacterium]MDW8263912.1 cytidylate kinase-like family protein [Gemmataceae bacterium]
MQPPANTPDYRVDLDASAEVVTGSPQHGYRGDRLPAAPTDRPLSLTIAVSRETGARGASIAQMAGRKLGWQVFTQESLEYLAHEPAQRENIISQIPSELIPWVESRLAALRQPESPAHPPSLADMAQVVLALAAQGDVVLVGRGAGFLLPGETTLHVRIVAPVADRVAYMSQRLRLTTDQAAELVKQRDQQRADFVATHFHRQPGAVHLYDLVLNSSLLGEELCAELIVQAARAKKARFVPPS